MELGPNTSIAIVVDPEFGAKLFPLAESMPVWIVDTPANRKSVESFWSDDRLKSRSVVTVFGPSDLNRSDLCLAMLPEVDLHHGEYSQSPPYDSVEVIGTTANTKLREGLATLGFTIESERSNGFRAVR